MSTQNSIILPEKQAKARMDRQLKGLKKKKQVREFECWEPSRTRLSLFNEIMKLITSWRHTATSPFLITSLAIGMVTKKKTLLLPSFLLLTTVNENNYLEP